MERQPANGMRWHFYLQSQDTVDNCLVINTVDRDQIVVSLPRLPWLLGTASNVDQDDDPLPQQGLRCHQRIWQLYAHNVLTNLDCCIAADSCQYQPATKFLAVKLLLKLCLVSLMCQAGSAFSACSSFASSRRGVFLHRIVAVASNTKHGCLTLDIQSYMYKKL